MCSEGWTTDLEECRQSTIGRRERKGVVAVNEELDGTRKKSRLVCLMSVFAGDVMDAG